jgi:crotonobetainyl-CoA:carnitine CoA-transferase CaiB-like acyl-CoA transferase
MSKPKIFTGVRVIELCQYVAGPFTTKILADMGAEVIKIELAPRGDMMRHYPPLKAGISGGYITENRGKRSVCVNLKKPEGVEIVRALAGRADVMVENFTPGVLPKYGLGYDSLHAINPRLIMCSISGYGQTGPAAHKPANDNIAMAASGLLDLIGNPGQAPAYPGVVIADVSAAINAFGTIASALYYREKTGVGQYIDLSLMECASYFNSQPMANYAISGGKVKVTRFGSHARGLVPFGVFRGSGGYVAITVLFHQWEDFVKLMGRPELASDPRFAALEDRSRNRVAAIEIVEQWLQSFPSLEEPIELMEANHIMCQRVLDVADMFTDPQLLERGALAEVDQPGVGPMMVNRTPYHFSETAVEVGGPAPRLGEDNERVLCEVLGYSRERVEELTRAGILVREPVPAPSR